MEHLIGTALPGFQVGPFFVLGMVIYDNSIIFETLIRGKEGLTAVAVHIFSNYDLTGHV